MKNILHIYKEDMRSIVTNVMTLIIVGGLIVLPSLYAWLNIKASWDPYAQTDQIPIGFVNEDEGAVVRGENIDVGSDLAERLEQDDNFSWHFVERKEGMDEVEYGNFFALIIIPRDFSETLGSVISDQPEKATINYYVNEKINAISPKITDKGASVLVEEISSEFIAAVNGVIFQMFNDIGLELEQSLPDIEKFEEYVFLLEENLPNIYTQLKDIKSQVEAAENTLTTMKESIPTIEEKIGTSLHTIQETTRLLESIEDEIKDITPQLKDKVEDIDEGFSYLKEVNEELHTSIAEKKQDVNFSNIKGQLTEQEEHIKGSIDSLEAIQSQLEEPNENLHQIIVQLEELQDIVSTVSEEVDELTQFTNEYEALYADIEAYSESLSTIDFTHYIDELEATVEPMIQSEMAKGKSLLKDAEQRLKQLEDAMPKIALTIDETIGKANKGKQSLEKGLQHYPSVESKINNLADQIRLLQSEADLQEIIELLLNDPDQEKSFFREPVLLEKHEVFPIPNYGTGMTPFYTVLSLWVGGLLLISLLSPNVPASNSISPKIVYMGRLLTFLTIGILQTLIVTLGDMFIVGVTVSNKLWFVLFGLLISVVFMSIVYTAVAVLGDVGKAVAIILLVLQIASSGGTYPVVLLPEFFQMVHPFLPFTYGVDLMREAVGGIIWGRALKNISFLFGFLTISILVGIFLKGPVQKVMSKRMNSKGGRLFHE